MNYGILTRTGQDVASRSRYAGRGIVAYGASDVQTNSGISNNFADVGLQASFNARAGMLYRLDWRFTRILSTVYASLGVIITDANNVPLINAHSVGVAIDQGISLSGTELVSIQPGPMTFKFRATTDQTTAAIFQHVTYASYFSVEEVGSAFALGARR